MLQPQRSKLLGDLYYNETPREYVAPPTQARIALNAKKEQDYILTNQMNNELDRIKRTLPYLEQSSPVYNQLVSKLDNAMSGITPENYTDNVLNVEQIGNDFMNKWGGNELTQEYSMMQEAKKTYETAYEKGELKDRGMVDWFKQRVGQQGGLTIDENGNVSRPNVGPIPYAKDRNPEKELDDLFKGWESDGSITRNKDGSISINRSIPGYFTTGENEFISEKELFDAGMRVLQNDGGMQAYFKQKAEYDLRNVPADANTINSALSPQLKQQLFGNANAGAEDIQLAISNGSIDPNRLMNNLYATELQADAAMFPAAKYGFNKEKLNTLKDELLLKSLEQEQKNLKDAKEEELSNVSVTVQPFMAQAVLNPTEVGAIKTQKAGLSAQRATMQAKINEYSKAVSAKRSGYTQDQLDLMNSQQTKLDNDIAELSYQEKQISKVMKDNFTKAGIDLSELYKTNDKNNLKVAVQKNAKSLENLGKSTNNSLSIDLTGLVKESGDNAIVTLNNGEKQSFKISNTQNNNNPNTYVLKQNGNYILKPGKAFINSSNFYSNLSNELFDENGKPSSRVTINVPNAPMFYRKPNEDEYADVALDAYTKGEKGTNLVGIEKKEYIYDDIVTNGAILKGLDTVRNKVGDFEFNITQPLNYIMVQGETSKDNLVAYTNDRKALNESFKTTPEQYTITTPAGEMNISDYIKEELRLPSIDSKYINWDKSSIETLSQTDRKYGQKYGISLVLTEEGKDKLGSGWGGSDAEDSYSRTNSIKLVAVNQNKNVPAEQARIQNGLLKAYADVAPDNSVHGVNMKKEMGLLHFNNSPDGTNMDKLNLYTLSAGAEKPINIAGTEYIIQTSAKDATASDLMNVNFHLSKMLNGQKVVLADGGSKGTAWKTLAEVEGGDWSRVTFETPDDMKSIIGATMLDNAYKTSKASSPTRNVYAEFLQGSAYKSVGNDTIQANNYGRILKDTKSFYGSGDFTSKVINNRTGKTENIKTSIPQEDLYDLRTNNSSQIAANNRYPYVNKAIAPKVETVLNDYDLVVTGGFRGKETHFGMKGAGKDSLHNYAGALDFRADKKGLEFYDKVASNPAELARLGIAKIMKHNVDGVLHVHAEFIP